MYALALAAQFAIADACAAAPLHAHAFLVARIGSRPASALVSQTISFPAIGSRTYGAAPFAISATASSGLPVAFASLTTAVCTVSAATVTIKGAGTCTIRASQPGDATYAAAPNVDQSFAIAKASQTISFGALAGKTYGDASFAVAATASSGLAVTFASSTTGVCTVSGSTVTIKGAGTCTLTASQAGNANYNAAPSVSQSFAIAKANQTITFSTPPNKTYGDPSFTVVATASSGLAVTFASSTTGVCTMSGSTATIKGAGTCTLTASQAGNANYNAAASVTRSFTVAKASQSITFAAPPGKTFGNPPFTVSAVASSGLAVAFSSVTTGVCTVSGSTVTLRGAGTCTLVASQAGSVNYNAAPSISQSFSVAKADQTIAFPAVSSQVAGFDVALSASASSALAVVYGSLAPAVCTVSGSIATLVSAGQCAIEATQPGNANYNSAPSVSRTFQVAPGARFAAEPVLATGASPLAVATGDFTGRGRADVAVANHNDRTVSIFLDNADGTLTFKATVATSALPRSVATGDVDGDGNVDIIVGNEVVNALALYRGNGDGTFNAAWTLSVALVPYAVALADFNGDGKLDLVVADGTSGSTAGEGVRVMLGKGDGTFQPAVWYWTGTFPQALAIGDIDNDGRLDLAVADHDADNIRILLGRGDGTFATGLALPTGDGPRSIASADLDGDGNLDIVTANDLSGDVSVLLGRGDGTFAPPARLWSGSIANYVAIADFNGDGRPDLAVTQAWTDNVAILLGAGDGTFRPAQAFATGPAPGAITIADLNGDRKADLVIANFENNSLSVLLNSSAFMPVASLATQAGTPQSAPVSTTYAAAFTAIARDASGQPVPGAAVWFIAPASGSSGIFASGRRTALAAADAAGVAVAPAFTANATPGSFAVVASSGNANARFSLTNGGSNAQPPLFTSAAAPAGTLNSPYAFTLTASGIPVPAFSVSSGALPTGVALDASTGRISGVPIAAGTFTGTFKAANGISPDATQSFSIAIAKIAQTIAFAPIGPRTLGSAPFAVTATASSGLTVSFSSLTPSVCTLSGTTVTLVAAGTCTPRASQAGDATYASASADQSFAVTAPSQTITFAPLPNRPIGAAPFTASATASSGLPVSFASLTTATCTVSGSTVSLLAIGTCTIRASQAGNATYPPAPDVDRTFAITLASQTIAFAQPADQRMGSSPVMLDARASSGLPVTLVSLTASVCNVGGNLVVVLAAGTCTIHASQSGNGYYAAAPSVDRSFTVARGSQAIVFAPLHDWALGVLPDRLHATASSGLPVSYSSRSASVCAVGGDVLTLLAVGPCTVRASQPGDVDYDPAPDVERTFSVTRASQTIAFWSIGTQSLQASPVAITATASSGLPVTFASLTGAMCTVSGNTVTLLAAGTCTVRASQSGNANYAPIASDQSFTVASAAAASPPARLFTGPILEYATYLGGLGNDKAFDVVVTPDGTSVVGGSVASTNFPGLSSSSVSNAGLDLLFLSRIDANGHAQSSVAVGGRAADITDSGALAYVGALQSGAVSFYGGGQVEAMAADTTGNVYVAAYLSSTDYPLRGGTYLRSGTKHVFRSSASGALERITPAIDPAVQTIRAIAVDRSGSIYATGVAGPGLATTTAAAIASMPTPTGALGAATAPYLIKYTSTGNLAFATYLSVPGSRAGSLTTSGQSLVDAATTGYAVAVDDVGNSYVAGQASAADFPVSTGAPDTADVKSRDAFVAKVDPTGSRLAFVARLGGSDAERATGIALAPDGTIVIGGKTATQPFVGDALQSTVYFAPQTPAVERETGFVARLAADGTRWTMVAPLGTAGGNLVASAFPGNVDPYPVKVAVDRRGAIYAAGTTHPSRSLVDTDTFSVVQIGWLTVALETIAPAENEFAGVRRDGAFVMKIPPDATNVSYVAALGGGVASGLALDGFGNAYLTGYSGPGLPVAAAGQAAPSFGGSQPTPFLAKVNDALAPLSLASSRSRGNAGQPIYLIARLADARYAGSVDFLEGSNVLGSASVVDATATLPIALSTGIHRLRAVFSGAGPFNGSASAEIVLAVDQASGAP